MTDVLLKAAAFMLVIVFGVLLKRWKVVPEEAGAIVRSIVINLTLPCAIIVNFASVESIGSGALLLSLLGLIANVIMLGVGMAFSKNMDKYTRAMYMICVPAFNIGAFGLPFVQSFLPAEGTVYACMFDVGNSIMCTGVTFAFVSAFVGESDKGFDLKNFAHSLVTSVPLMTYVVMFALAMVGIRLPQGALTLIEPMANANAFLAMLMIGLLMKIRLDKEYMADIVKMLGLRHVFAVIMAVICMVFVQDEILRLTMLLVAFTPMSAVAPAYTGLCGGDEGKASAANSLSILLSVAELTLILIVLS